MANIFSPFGFRQFRRMDGGAPTFGFDTLTIASSDTNLYFTGDPVATSTTGPYVTLPTSGTGQIRGIFQGCEFFSPTVGRKVWSPFFPGSVATTSGTNDAQAWVVTDPEMTWLVQTGSATAAGISPITSSEIGLNCGWSFGTSSQGNQTTGISQVTVNSTGAPTTSSSLPFRILDLYSNYAPPGTNGTDNTTASNMIIVTGNNWDRKNLTGI
jgi:hypothetical protein